MFYVKDDGLPGLIYSSGCRETTGRNVHFNLKTELSTKTQFSCNKTKKNRIKIITNDLDDINQQYHEYMKIYDMLKLFFLSISSLFY